MGRLSLAIGVDAGLAGRFVNDAGLDTRRLQAKLDVLMVEHRDLDAAIAALVDAGSSDQVQIARLKKRKLRLKDEIANVQDAIIPDIIA